MELAELQVFLTVAAERSFSRAAEKLHRTQPAVSQAIRRLEDELGERLFDRSSKQGTLTEAGRVLREYAQRLLATQRGGRDGRARAARSAPRPRAHRRQRRRGPRAAAAHRPLPHASPRDPGGRAPRRRRQVGVEVVTGESRLRRRDVSAGRARIADAEPGARRSGDARASTAPAGRPQGSDARRVRARDGHRAQRSVARA